jgi:hypothetical protein
LYRHGPQTAGHRGSCGSGQEKAPSFQSVRGPSRNLVGLFSDYARVYKHASGIGRAEPGPGPPPVSILFQIPFCFPTFSWVVMDYCRTVASRTLSAIAHHSTTPGYSLDGCGFRLTQLFCLAMDECWLFIIASNRIVFRESCCAPKAYQNCRQAGSMRRTQMSEISLSSESQVRTREWLRMKRIRRNPAFPTRKEIQVAPARGLSRLGSTDILARGEQQSMNLGRAGSSLHSPAPHLHSQQPGCVRFPVWFKVETRFGDR